MTAVVILGVLLGSAAIICACGGMNRQEGEER